MIQSLRHPGFRKLNRYVDGDLRDAERARAAAHIARCDACRETVAKLRALGAAARDLPTPDAPANLIDLVLRRRAAGDRVILPVTPPGPARRRSLAFPMAAAAVAILAVATVLMLHAPVLQAAAGGLTISPARPTAGARLSLDYRDMGRFQGQQQLAVRARYRTAGRQYQLTAAILERTADGDFRGTITLPDSVVYAAFAVEDPAGRTVDSNGRRLWDVTVHAPDGRPTFEALAARLDDLNPRNWEGAFDVARQMTRLYPERPASWLALESFQRAVLDDSTVLPRLARRLGALRRTLLAGDHPDAESLAALAYGYAFALGRQDVSRQLVARIDAEHGWSRVRTRYRLSLSWIAAGGDRSRYLASLDSLWALGGDNARVARAGLFSSLAADDPDLAWTWYQRVAAADPDGVIETLTETMLPIPALRTRVTHALEHAVRDEATPDPERRPLYLSVPAYSREEKREMGQARVTVGTALLASGKTAEGLRQLRLAISDVWNPAILHQAGRILLARGDTAAAVEAYGRMAADPALPPELGRAVADELGALTRSEQWKTTVASARAMLEKDILADRINLPVDTALVLGEPSGKAVALAQLMSPRATAVVFWSWRSLPAVDSARAIERVRRRLSARNIRTIVIVTEPRSAEMEQALSRLHVPFPVYTDLKGQATRD
ncbi:MAG: zf-HC2 domain-containing protein, partial [Gemmatimonadota bacterium]